MSSTDLQKNVEVASEKYSASFTKGDLALPPAKKYLVAYDMLISQVTCMDARIDPAAAYGINLGDAHVIRNAGGNAKDALRSILISQHLLGTREIILVKHTGCGMLTFSNNDALKIVADNVGTGVLASTFDFQPFPDLEKAVQDDVGYLQGHSALVKGTIVSGWIYDVRTGRTSRVV